MGTISEKLTYLNGTKTALKDMINLTGAGITSETTFRNYATKLYDGYVEILKDKYTLLDAMPKGTGTGVNVSVQDAVDLPVYNLEMDKESTQNTTTGKNIFDNTILPKITTNTSTEIIENGKRIINTGPTVSTSLFVVFVIKDLSNDVGKTIRLKSNFNASGNNNGRAYIGLGNENGENRTSKAELVVSGQTISFVVPTLAENQTYLILVLYANYGSTTVQQNDYVDYTNLILTIDNENMDYEEYTGGQPSPNPDYPQEVNTVKGYRNLLETGVGTNTSYGLNIDYNNASFEVKGTLTNTYFIYLIKTLTNNISAGTYTLSRTDTTTNLNIRVTYTDNTQYTDYMGNNKTKKIVFDKEVKQIQLFSDSLTSGTYYEFTNNIQIVEGDIILPFIPYGNNYIYTKVIGKNLFDKNNANILNAYFNSENASSLLSSSNAKTIYIPCESNTTYTISKITSARFYVGYTEETPAINVTVYGRTGGNNLNTPITITTGANATHIVAFIYFPGADTLTLQQILDSIQIEKSSTATEYESYQESITTIPLNNNEIVGIENYKDELLVDKSGHVFINKKTGKAVLDGSENWIISTSFSNPTYSVFVTNDFNNSFANNKTILSNYFVNNNRIGTETTTQEGIGYYSDVYGLRISILKATVDTIVNDWKTWLGTHNTDVYYVLAQEELIDLQTTIDIELFKGTNNISNSEDANMQIRYVKSVEDLEVVTA